MKSKILLISLPGINSGSEPLFPLGIGYLLSSIKRDREAEAIHYQFMTHASEQIPSIIESYNPDIIGLTCTTFNRGNVKQICFMIKEKYPNIKIILGGVHVSFLPEQALRNYKADYVVIGEGEETLREVCNVIDGNLKIENVLGVAYLYHDSFIKTPPRITIKNLDDLVIPDFSFVEHLMIQSKLGFVISSRGCPVRCDFCSTGSYWGQKVRLNSPKRIVDEIELLISKYGVNKIFFHDDTFNIQPKRSIEICDEILKRNLKIKWAVSCRVHPFTEEMLDKMVEAGCKHICWGVETGSDEMLQRINKKITKEQISNAFKLCEKYIGQITVGAFMMIGNPGENENTVNDTVNFINTLKLTDNPGTAMLYILPGTKIYKDLLLTHPEIENSWIENDGINFYTYENSFDQLTQWASRITSSGQRVNVDMTNHFWNGTLFGNVPCPVSPPYERLICKK